MQSPEERLKELGIILPKYPTPVGNYTPFVRHENLLYLSGQGPLLEDGIKAKGKVGLDVTTEQAYEHARRVGLVMLSVIRDALGSLDRAERVVKLLGMVNSTPDFNMRAPLLAWAHCPDK